MSEKSLVLYMSPGCPYCRRVMSYMDRHNVKLPERDISRDPSAREELVRVGGKGQVPCLFIDGEPLYESADIIEYLAAHEV